GKSVILTGSDLSLPQIAAIALYPSPALHARGSDQPHAPPLSLSPSPALRAKHAASRHVIDSKVSVGLSIYGVSTGFGGSADTRTDDPVALGAALLQHQHVGVIVPSSASLARSAAGPMPLTDQPASTTMPPPWIRAAMLIRTNSLLRGHSGVRWELVEKMAEVIQKGLVPCVPLRGTVSASGDLTSLSYIAGMLIANPAIRVWMLAPPAQTPSPTYSAPHALSLTKTAPLPLASKEHLGILNGTAFSAGIAALVVGGPGGAAAIGILGSVLTAMAVEAMVGSRGSFDKFVGEARPHAGQVESARLMHALLDGSEFASHHEEEVRIEEDEGVLRQDRYSLRTAPQWLGPQFEDMKRVLETVRVEVNSTTDNPLVEPPNEKGEEGTIHHAGNFQALSLTNAMDHLRLSLAHIGKLMFVQLTEIVNPAMNRGLPGNLAGGEGALDFGCKGLDLAAASYAGELNALGGMNVGVGNVSAEMHNQSVNSLALVSARYTITALEVVQLLAATHLYVLCQALDCRALWREMQEMAGVVVRDCLGEVLGLANDPQSNGAIETITKKVMPYIQDALDKTTSMDTSPRMVKVAGAAVAPLLEAVTSLESSITDMLNLDLVKIAKFRSSLAQRLEALLVELRCAYFGRIAVFNIPSRGPAPASRYLAARTRILYEFVRLELGIKMAGGDNLKDPEKVDTTIGDKVAMILEAIRDGRVGRVVASMCEGC
ncbi:phenylalanine ammonia-lyase, partial [Phlebopus sp. FC_14]